MLSACSINKVILMGRLTSDPELRQTSSGVNTCQITVAVNRGYTTQDGERPTDFITVVAWRQTAEFISRYFNKGKIILVEGELRTRTYDDKRYPDVRHYVTEVYADNVSFGETKASAGGQGGGNFSAQPYSQPRQQDRYSQPVPQQNDEPAPSLSFGDIGEGGFEEVIGDGDLPF